MIRVRTLRPIYLTPEKGLYLVLLQLRPPMYSAKLLKYRFHRDDFPLVNIFLCTFKTRLHFLDPFSVMFFRNLLQIFTQKHLDIVLRQLVIGD